MLQLQIALAIATYYCNCFTVLGFPIVNRAFSAFILLAHSTGYACCYDPPFTSFPLLASAFHWLPLLSFVGSLHHLKPRLMDFINASLRKELYPRFNLQKRIYILVINSGSELITWGGLQYMDHFQPNFTPFSSNPRHNATFSHWIINNNY